MGLGVSCGTAESEADADATAVVVDPVESTQGSSAISSGPELGDFILNVNLTGKGFDPPSVFIPVGRTVRLTVRNRDSTEHHYRVVGMAADNLLWRSQEEEALDTSDPPDEMASHHIGGTYLPFREVSPAGIRPFGDEVHAYVSQVGTDVVYFKPTSIGTFIVECPLHPDFVGQVTVY